MAPSIMFKYIDATIRIVFEIPKISTHVGNTIEVTTNSNKKDDADNNNNATLLSPFLAFNMDPKKSRTNTIILHL
jgi:hypothetical protein